MLLAFFDIWTSHEKKLMKKQVKKLITKYYCGDTCLFARNF